MPFNVDKCQVLQVERRNKKFDYEMRGVKLKSVQCAKDLGVKIMSNLKFSQQCIDAANEANRMLVLIKRNFFFKNKNVVLPLYTSLVTPHFEYVVQFWSPHHAKDNAKFEGVQRRAKKKKKDRFLATNEESLSNCSLLRNVASEEN